VHEHPDAGHDADAVAIVRFLFGGGKTPYCAALADANGDGATEIADAVFLLRYLFQGGAAPAPARVDCR